MSDIYRKLIADRDKALKAQTTSDIYAKLKADQAAVSTTANNAYMNNDYAKYISSSNTSAQNAYNNLPTYEQKAVETIVKSNMPKSDYHKEQLNNYFSGKEYSLPDGYDDMLSGIKDMGYSYDDFSKAVEWQNEINAAKTAYEEDEYFKQLAKDNKLASALLTTTSLPLKSYEFVKEVAIPKVTGKDIDVKDMKYTRASDAMREGVVEGVTEATGSKILGTGASLGMSALDSIASGVIMGGLAGTAGKVGSSVTNALGGGKLARLAGGAAKLGTGMATVGAPIGLSASASTALDVAERGGTDNQIFGVSALAGLAEGLFEGLSIDNLYSLITRGGKNTAAQTILRGMASQSLTEGTEEALTEITNKFVDDVAMGDKSHTALLIQSYMAQGMSREQAEKEALKQGWLDVAGAFVGGAVMGGVMGGGAATINEIANNSTYTQLGQVARQSGDTSAITAIADMVTDKKLAQRAKNADFDKMSDNQIGRLITELQNARFKTTSENEGSLSDNNAKTPQRTEMVANSSNDIESVAKKQYTDTNVQKIFTEAYEEAQASGKNYSVDDFSLAFSHYYQAGLEDGRSGVSIEDGYSKVRNDVLSEVMDISPSIKQKAYSAGQVFGTQRMTEQKAYVPPVSATTGVNKALSSGYSKIDKGLARSLDKLGKVLGANIIIDSVNDLEKYKINTDAEGGQVINGFHIAKDDTIHIVAENSDRAILKALAHEITHRSEFFSPEEHQKLRNVVVKAMGNKFNEVLESKRKLYSDISYDELVNEVVADATEAFLADEAFIDELVSTDRSLAQKVLDFIRDVLKKISTMLRESGLSTAEAKILYENKKYLKQAEKLWVDALQATATRAAETRNSEDSISNVNTPDKKFSLSSTDSQGNTLSEQQKEYFKDSKVVDSEGKLLVMYHGTPSGDFTVFKDGSYFTANRAYADTYQNTAASSISTGKVADNPKTYAVYLNIKKPFDINDKTARDIYINEYIKGGNAIGINPYLSDSEYDTIKSIDWTEGEDLRDFLLENGYDYDGLILDEGATGGYGDDVSSRGESYVIFNPNQVKNLDNKNPTEDKDIRFSLSSPVEKVGDLIAVHNLNEQKLRGNFELGGMPAPSIAITKADMGHSGYGEISLVFSSDTIDPKFDSRNDVFSADAYTSRFPRVDIKIESEALRDIADRLDTSYSMLEANEFSESTEEDIVEHLSRNNNAKKVFIKENNIEYTPVLHKPTYSSQNFQHKSVAEFIARDDVTFDKLVNDSDYREEYLKVIKEAYGNQRLGKGALVGDKRSESVNRELDACKASNSKYKTEEMKFNNDKKIANGVATLVEDSYSHIDGINNAVKEHTEEFKKWLSDLVKPAIGKKYIRKDVDPYTRSGNRKSFEQMHDAYTLSNIIKNMKRGTNVEAGFGGVGIGEMRASTSKKYSNIDEIRQSKPRLQNLSDEEIETAYNDAAEMLSEARNKLYQYSKFKSGNSFIDLDNVGENIKDAFMKYSSDNGIIKYLKEYYPQAPQSVFNRVIELKQILEELPVKYFEAKPMRAVYFDEVKYAVVPDNVSADIVEQLENYGVKIVQYENENQADRTEKLNSLDDIRFSLSNTNRLRNGKNNLISLDNETSEEYNDNQKIFKQLSISVADNATIEEVVKENAELRSIISDLEKQTQLSNHDLNDKDIDRIARAFKKDYSSKIELDTLKSKLKIVYDAIAKSEIDGTTAHRAFNVIAREVIDHSEQTVELDQIYQDVKADLKNVQIYIGDEVKSEVPDSDINAFRKKNFGRFKVAKGNTNIDKVYNDLSTAYPSIFPSDAMTAGDQLAVIESVAEVIYQKNYENPYDIFYDEAASDLALRMYNDYFDVREDKTFADKKQKELIETRIKYQNRIDKLRESYKERNDKALKELRAEKNEQIAKLREQKNERINAEIAKRIQVRKDTIAKKNESFSKAKYRRRVNTQAKDLEQMLLHPTDKKHIPEKMKQAIKDVLLSFDFGSKDLYKGEPTKKTVKWLELRSKIEAVATEEGSQYEFDPEIANKIQELHNAVGNKKVDEYNSSELKLMSEILASIKAAIKNENTALSGEQRAMISEKAETAISYFDSKKSKEQRNALLEFASDVFASDMLDSFSYFKLWGESGNWLINNLSEAFDKRTNNLKKAADYSDKVLDGIDTKEMTGKTAKVHTIQLESGHTIRMTTGQIMSFYELAKREQGLNHLLGGGMKRTSISGDFGKIDRMSVAEKLTVNDIINITSLLTEEQKKVADDLQKFFKVTAEWGNEVSMAKYGYKKYTEQNYFPITSDEHFIDTKIDDAKATGVSRLENLGFTKSTVRNANNAVTIGDIFDVYTRQIEQMANYNAFVPILTDMNKLINYRVNLEQKSIKTSIERALGKNGITYYDTLMRALNNDYGNASISGFEKIAAKLMSGTKIASVAANLRVIIQQPTAYARAAALLNPKYMTEALVGKTTDEAIIEKYAPIYTWKKWGFFEIGTGRSIRDIILDNADLKRKIQETAMAGAAAMDSMTWKRIWKACEFEIADTTDLETGSEEFYTAVGKRFTQVVHETQVVDTVLDRSALMRSKNMFVKQATAFMSEPTKSYNMVARAIMTNKKAVARTMLAVEASIILNAMAKALIDAARDDDKDKDLFEKLFTHARDNALEDNLPFNYIPFAKDIVSILKGYDVARMDMQPIDDIINAAQRVYSLLEKDEETGERKGSKYSIASIVIDSIGALSSITGIPISNITREIESAANFTSEVGDVLGVDSTRLEYNMLTYQYSPLNHPKPFYDVMFDAETSGNSKLVSEIKNRLIKVLGEETYNNKLKTYQKTYLEANYSEELEDLAEAKLALDLKTYGEGIAKFTKMGFSRDNVLSVINGKSDEVGDVEIKPTAPSAELEGDAYDYDMLYMAYQNDSKTYDSLYNSLLAAGKTESGIKSSIKSRLKDDYIAAFQSGQSAMASAYYKQLMAMGTKPETVVGWIKEFSN